MLSVLWYLHVETALPFCVDYRACPIGKCLRLHIAPKRELLHLHPPPHISAPRSQGNAVSERCCAFRCQLRICGPSVCCRFVSPQIPSRETAVSISPGSVVTSSCSEANVALPFESICFRPVKPGTHAAQLPRDSILTLAGLREGLSSRLSHGCPKLIFTFLKNLVTEQQPRFRRRTLAVPSNAFSRRGSPSTTVKRPSINPVPSTAAIRSASAPRRRCNPQAGRVLLLGHQLITRQTPTGTMWWQQESSRFHRRDMWLEQNAPLQAKISGHRGIKGELFPRSRRVQTHPSTCANHSRR